MAVKVFATSSASAPYDSRNTLSNRERKEMKSAHSFTLSKDCRALSTMLVNFLYFASLARSD